MAKIVTVEYVDDLDGVSIEADSVDTVDFSYRGQTYSLMLTAENGAQFDKDIARYIKAAKKAAAREARDARKDGRRGRPTAARRFEIVPIAPPESEPQPSVKPKAPARAKNTSRSVKPKAPARAKNISRNAAPAVKDSVPKRTRAIREWAGVNGYDVSPRGRLAARVIEAYDAAH